jgi:hypothetical protein
VKWSKGSAPKRSELKQQRIKAMDTGLTVALVVILQIIVIVLVIIGVRYRLIRKRKIDADNWLEVLMRTVPHPEPRHNNETNTPDRPSEYFPEVEQRAVEEVLTPPLERRE